MENQLHYIEQNHLLNKKAEEIKIKIQHLLDDFEKETKGKIYITNFMEDRKVDIMVCINEDDLFNLNLME